MTVYLLSYNNYYNRKVEYRRAIEEYLQEANVLYTQTDTNFNPNDGVSTSLILNYSGEVEPDYLLVVDEPYEIVGRWYVIDATRLCQGQYKFNLYRDLVSEYFSELMDAPMFVEKAKIPAGNNLIYNNENMSYNQIKQNEYPLKDKTGVPWIVGYVPRNYAGGTITIAADDTPISYNLASLDQYQYNEYTTTTFAGDYNKTNANYRILICLNGPSTANTRALVFDKNCIPSQPIQGKHPGLAHGNGWISQVGNNGFGWNSTEEVFVDKTAQLYEIIKGVQMKDLISYTPCHTTLATQQFLAENNKIIQVDSNFYRIQIKGTRKVQTFDIPNASELANQMSEIAVLYGSSINMNKITGSAYQVEVEYEEYTLEYIQASVKAYSLIIPQERIHLQDAPYDMFCMPYGDIAIEGVNGGNAIDNFRFANTLAIELTQNNLFDLQLLPYCPLAKEMVVIDQGVPSIQPSAYYTNTTTRGKAVQYIADTEGAKYGAIFWCENSSFITDTLTFDNVSVPTDPVEFKVENECSFYRICSPNYNGVFEISATKNKGLGDFTASCSYKPFSPYIKVAPQFNGLYVRNYGDARGLICGGDFSLPFITDAWKQYQIQNKNYQAMFDRQIENMEVNNSIQRIADIANIATGTISGAATGAAVGSMAGGGVGAVVGGAAGALASLVGGAADISLNERLRNEALDYTKDQFGYQLGNIKALPQSLTKISAFNVDNKIFPFVEYYTATQEEKQALRQKLIYNGMTVMTIGTLREYFRPDEYNYFKGKLIRFDNFNGDYHALKTLAEEMYKGVFI